LVAEITSIIAVNTTALRRALRRGAFHAFIGSAIVVGVLCWDKLALLIALGAATALFLIFEAARLHLPSLNQRFLDWFAPLLRKEESARPTGSSYFMIACLITVLAFPRHIAAPAILFLSLGDPAATVIGVWRGHIRLWDKSVEGHAACLIICFLVAILLVGTLDELSLTVALAGAAIATFFQALPRMLNDNLTIPLGSAACMRLTAFLT